MPTGKHHFVRHYTADEVTFTPNTEGVNAIFRKIEAQRKAFHACLGTPEGLRIPDKPLPAASRSAVDTTPMNQQS